MTEFGETTIGNTSPQKPEREKINLGNVQLSDNKQQIDLDETRVKLFDYAIKWAIKILISVVATLLITVLVYLYLLLCPTKEIPSNFWHIPLLLAFMASTILSVILTLTARFGEKRKPNDEGSETPIKTLVDGVKEIKNLLQDFISSKP